MDDVVSITLLRHGLTNENQQKKYLGWTDSRINEVGKQELYRLKEKHYPKPDLIITSDLIRCRETAEILFPMQMFRSSKLFREYHFGSWDTLGYDQLKDNHHYRNWIDDPLLQTPPNGESFDQFKKRVLTGYKALVSHFEDDSINNITIVTHGGPIRLLLTEFAPIQKRFWEWNTPYGKGYVLIGNRLDVKGMKPCTSLQEAPLMEN